MSNGNDGESTRRRSSESVISSMGYYYDYGNESKLFKPGTTDFVDEIRNVLDDIYFGGDEERIRAVRGRRATTRNTTNIQEAEEQRDEEENSEEPIRVIRRQVPEEPTEEVEEPIRIIRREVPEEPETENIPDEDIGEVRQKVIDELFDELYGELKSEVKEELLKAKPEIVRQATQELKNKLLNELKDQNIKGGKENDR